MAERIIMQHTTPGDIHLIEPPILHIEKDDPKPDPQKPEDKPTVTTTTTTTVPAQPEQPKQDTDKD